MKIITPSHIHLHWYFQNYQRLYFNKCALTSIWKMKSCQNRLELQFRCGQIHNSTLQVINTNKFIWNCIEHLPQNTHYFSRMQVLEVIPLLAPKFSHECLKITQIRKILNGRSLKKYQKSPNQLLGDTFQKHCGKNKHNKAIKWIGKEASSYFN